MGPMERRSARIALLLGLTMWLGCATAPPPSNEPQDPPERERFAPSDPDKPVLDAEAAARARVVAIARSMVGVTYRYGGTTPDGFDCSGLVRYSYEHSGFSPLPRSSRAQFVETERIPLSQLEPGDLLFFKFRGRSVSHVAIYLGGDEFVHAAKTTRTVERVRLDHPYWSRELDLAGRVRWPEREAAR
jgi:murein DD-endopeptidase